MASIELYINKQLCDIENPGNFSVYLKRQLINPSELSTKDAQRSYDITLPASSTNNKIFGHTNTEEVKGKFSQLYDAVLYVDSVKIFEGKFRMSEISKTYYKGNLGIPAAKTVKDIFGEKNMNEGGNWKIPFKDQTSITEYNNKENPACFFPLVLYGLLPKKPIREEEYTEKNILDKTVNFHRDNFPPSINCLEMLKELFRDKGLILSGSAYTDERLKRLYVSYRNPSEYEMMWNYGKLGDIYIDGTWGNYRSSLNGALDYRPERNYNFNENKKSYAVNLLNGSNSSIYINKDTGRSVTKDNDGYTITIPYSGLYKIYFFSIVNLGKTRDFSLVSNSIYNYNNPPIISPHCHTVNTDSKDVYEAYHNLKDYHFEIKVLRDKKDSSAFDLDKIEYDNLFYKNNLNQSENDIYPKYFPQSGEVNFIDPAQNKNILCGLSYGNKNPIDKNNRYCNPIAISGGESWNPDSKGYMASAATYSPGYIEQYKENNVIKERESSKYKVELQNAVLNQCSINTGGDALQGGGEVSQVVWLEKGEKITLVAYSKSGTLYKYKWNFLSGWTFETYHEGWILQEIRFYLYVEAFWDSKAWLKMNNDGSSSEPMKYSDPSNLMNEELDLIRFLPSEIKINDWIDHFCKAFNLDLIQTGANTFELNTKRQNKLSTSSIVNIDSKTDANKGRTNSSLGLPSAYEVGFTIDKNEQGYIESQYDGGGILETDSPDGKRVNQTSNFSYNWLKNITVDLPDTEKRNILLPIISEKEVWPRGNDYHEMKSKNYMSKAQRFWYKSKEKPVKVKIDGDVEIEAALVDNTLEHPSGNMRLDYKDDKTNNIHSILDTYFTLLTDVDNSYTTVECYLTPEEYNNIIDSYVQLNGDLYFVAEIDGYDPLCKKKTSLKLIRKQL